MRETARQGSVSARRAALALGLSGATLLGACGSGSSISTQTTRPVPDEFNPRYDERSGTERETIWDLFYNTDDPNTALEVNRYLWNASLDILGFLPIETVDPFSGVIVTGYGVPPGGGSAYRATIQVRDPALDARSLKVALATRGGPVDADTVRAVEDAILTRARQLRVQDSRL
ncbi:MAG: DUF3576 domain-containing protein [Paracoccaceae bacterium]|jgi:hypothetical protein|nr:DUF3576 domain-containing protein [Paracoccaceae bacterium]